ncbi:PqiB family protein [Thetidibacter halocola]|uniref:MCE family protein n=1 Tax=Thetidibacter halocola TaxID=2827239 RepID=A0A8J8B8X8_9RHOB|nr:MlaD family protein [Thetidibacter halocola]MBS0124980.1 MCE family protein [Thetidibacter halocola]
MTDHDTDTDTLRDVPLKKPSEARSGISMIWLIPVVALVASLGVAWKNWTDRGPLIEVEFAKADGVRAQETELRYRDITVGLVEDVRFSDDLGRVVAAIRLDKTIAPFVDADATFWIVRPQVTAQGVSGLDTVLSGVYIAGAWDGEPGEPQDSYIGADKAPLLALGESGVTFTLRSENGLPSENTPIYYRGVQVGRLGPTVVAEDGLTVSADAVILEPYTGLVSTAARFWDISGFSFSLGASGASLNFTSLASLIGGGVTFESLGSGGVPLANGDVFTLHPDEDTAREDYFLEGEGGTVDLLMIFEENLAGLSAGAPVTLGGLRMGEVRTIAGIVDPARFGDTEVRLAVTVKLNPGRIGLDPQEGEGAFLDYLDQRIAEGMRAQLTNASLLTGGLKVELVLVDDAAPATLDRAADPYPAIPTAPSNVTNVATTAQGLLTRVENLPVEELMAEVIGTLQDARGIIGSEDLQAAPGDLRATLQAVRALAESDEVAALPAQVGALAEGLSEASAKLNALLGDVQDQAVVAAVSDLIATLDRTAQTLPALAEQAGALLGQAEALPLQALADQMAALLGNADALLTDENVTAIPGDLRGTLASLRTLTESPEFAALPGQVGGLAEGLQQAADTVNTLLLEAQQRQIVTAVSDLVASLGDTAGRLPGIADQASAVLNDAENLALDDLAQQARALLDSIDALVDQPSTRDLPAELNGTLAELRRTLEELRAGGVVDNANATLASAREAAAAISEASRALPSLADRLSGLANRASATLGDYGANGDFGRDLSSAIRQIEAAAQSIDRLARQIQRNPNSLITGR